MNVTQNSAYLWCSSWRCRSIHAPCRWWILSLKCWRISLKVPETFIIENGRSSLLVLLVVVVVIIIVVWRLVSTSKGYWLILSTLLKLIVRPIVDHKNTSMLGNLRNHVAWLSLKSESQYWLETQVKMTMSQSDLINSIFFQQNHSKECRLQESSKEWIATYNVCRHTFSLRSIWFLAVKSSLFIFICIGIWMSFKRFII